MNLTQLETDLLSAGFQRTQQPLSFPVVIHGVPGCGKSTFIKAALANPNAVARTLGAPYGDSLATEGVRTHSPNESFTQPLRILDEYQLGERSTTSKYNLLFGDPYQGPFRLPPHFIKSVSHRVPRPVANFLRSRGFNLESETPGVLITAHPFHPDSATQILSSDKTFHLGTSSKQLCSSHLVNSYCPSELAGSEFQRVALVYHSTELKNKTAFYVACTRTRHTLCLVSDQFNEFCTTT